MSFSLTAVIGWTSATLVHQGNLELFWASRLHGSDAVVVFWSLKNAMFLRKMREHPHMLTTQRALNRLWHCENHEVSLDCLKTV